EGLLRVSAALFQIAFRIPIDREIAIGERQRILRYRLLHQGQSFFELAVMNRHLAESVKRDSSRDRIRRHVEDRVEGRSCFVPLARVMSINFTEVTKRSRVSWIHQMRLLVQPFGSYVFLSSLSDQTSAHHRFNSCAHDAIENWRRRDAADLVDTKLLQLLRGIFRFLWEQTLLFGDGLEQSDRAVVVAGLNLLLRTLQTRVERRLALFHFDF